MKSILIKKYALPLFASFIVWLSACEKSDPLIISEPLTGQQAVNSWIYEVMEVNYLWEDELPARPALDLDPNDFFDSLKVDQDRFSRLFPDYQALIAALDGVRLEAGYEFSLVKRNGDEVIAIITYIKPGSPAESAGLRRGDYIFKINGQAMTVSNYQVVLNGIGQNHTIEYSRYDDSSGNYVDQGSESLSVIQYSENPHFLDSIYTIENRRIGYYIYNFFSSPSFNDEMDNIIQGFGNENITDLIIDLRYNSGGYITAATNMASLIGSNISSSEVFFEFEFNDFIQSEQGPESNTQRFLGKTQNLGSLIDGQVYILVGRNTASASELVINGLDPFMSVTLIGETTVGKNVGSIAIEDRSNPENYYGLLPIVFYISNSVGFNDYGAGFTPEPLNEIKELTTPIYPLGDVRETLLSHTLGLITGKDIIAKKGASQGYTSIGSSLERRPGHGRLIMDSPISKKSFN